MKTKGHNQAQGGLRGHSIGDHYPFRVVGIGSDDEWLLYELYSPCAHGGRGFTRGSIYNRDGIRVASTAQEGLIRWDGHEDAIED